MSNHALPDRGRVWLAYLLVGAGAAVVQHLLAAQGVARVIGYVLISGSAAVAVFCGVVWHKPKPALPWLLLAWSQVLYVIADATFYTLHHVLGITTFPGLADLLYLAHYVLLVVGILLLIRHRTPGRYKTDMLDAAVLAFATALLSWVFLISLAGADGSPLLRAALLVYPVVDLAVLAVAIGLILGMGQRSPSFILLTGSLLATFTADTLYVLQRMNDTYQAGNFLDLIWLGGNLALGAAALHPTVRQLSEPTGATDRGLTRTRLALLLGAVLLGPALPVILNSRGDGEHLTATAVAGAALGTLVIVRMAFLAADQRRLAITDDLTGLHTRRFVESQLILETTRAARNGGQFAVLLLDVDHFKSINDRYGHPSGDQVLIEIAARLREAVRPGDVLARYGGEEFAVLVPGIGPDDTRVVADRIRRRVGDAPMEVSGGVRVTMTVSIGAASYPVDQTRPDQLIAVADRALYLAKAQGRDCAVVGDSHEPIPNLADAADAAAMVDFLRRVADYVDQRMSVGEHSQAIGRWAEVVASELGHDESTVRRAVVAGQLHDIGKIVVPAPILEKRQPITPEEARLLRQHPEHGARLARMVPGFDGVADIIRQHHERFNGTGYPRGLSGPRIRVEARIIAVCDAWAAMRVNRSYQSALSEERAVEQLRQGRGSQFDPDIVDVFISLLASGRVGELRPDRPERDGVAPTAAGSGRVRSQPGSA